ncbi:MAG: calcium-translocating P-type ATPase, PMCA-type [Candidatus Aenigmarchaeota archaeon]|nr:calcium-translocating P-type ATPase, PMCA-type [Candidatus Aenigmarchaeota archaeon]
MKRGLTEEEGRRKLKEFGKNEIRREKKVSPVKIFVSQFTSPIILLLIFAAILSFSVSYMKHESFFDSVLILIIVFASGIAGFIQDYKAEKTVEALQKMATPKARVIRDGKEKIIDSTDIVPGDLIVLEGGDIIPADAKILEGELEVDESILTGESRAKKKKTGDKIFSGCGIYSGKAIAEVFATGMKTEIGKIASRMQEIKEGETPFQSQMKNFTRKIVLMTIVVIVLTFFVGFHKFGFIEAGLIAVSLAVAAIPEDLPAVITIGLSLGAREMVKRNALVRRLAITESIGSTDVICTDKTGTITEGKMEVKDLWLLDESEKAKDLALKCCFYCNDAKKIDEDGKEKWIGDETDVALKIYSTEFVNSDGKRIDEIPFSSEREMMTVVQDLGEKLVFSKGAPEVIVKKSNRILFGDKVIQMDEETRNKILKKNCEFASKSYRVLGLAYKEYEKPLEEKLIFIGFVVLFDPPRPEVKEAIKECHTAGIRVIMITGDNPLTAESIGKEVGIETKEVITGLDMDRMSDDDLKKKLKDGVNIFARTSPFHKLRILNLLKEEGHVVAMTGDGVNDSLALKKADVGIAMGIKGTEVAKEASDIVLLDDNFATIRNAIKEGRRIFDNTRKFVNYLLTCNVAEVAVVLIATIFLPFISIYPVQILWINLITDGLPALALSIDPPRPDIMKRKPRKRNEGIINKKLALLIGGIGTEKSIIIISTFLAALSLTGSVEKARTVLFTGFIMYEFVRIGVIRYGEKLASLRDWLTNRFLVYSLLISFVLQLIIIYTPLASYFKVVPLGMIEWSILIVGTVVGFILGITITLIVDRITKEEY